MNTLDILFLQGGNNAYIWKYLITEGHSYSELHKPCRESPSLLQSRGEPGSGGAGLCSELSHGSQQRWPRCKVRVYALPTVTLFDGRSFKERSNQLSCLLKIFLIIWRHLVAKNGIEEKEFIPCHRKDQLFPEAWVQFVGAKTTPKGLDSYPITPR